MSTHTLTVDSTQDNAALAAVVRGATGVPWSAARALCEQGKVTVNGLAVKDPAVRVRAGAEVVINPEARGTGARNRPVGDLERARLVHLDSHVVVIDKPPGVNSVPYEPGEKDTLVDQLGTALHRWNLAPATAPLFVVHRLDRETTGLLVFGRTWTAKRHLGNLFRHHTVERVYVALVHGTFRAPRTITSQILPDRGDGLRGSARSPHPGAGQHAVTHVRPLAVLPHEGGATLVECRLETGRQHQIRIHLSEAGHPVVGDRVYIRNYRDPLLPAPRVMLHARTLGFTHPAREDEMMRFEAPIPMDLITVARRLGWSGDL